MRLRPVGDNWRITPLAISKKQLILTSFTNFFHQTPCHATTGDTSIPAPTGSPLESVAVSLYPKSMIP